MVTSTQTHTHPTPHHMDGTTPTRQPARQPRTHTNTHILSYSRTRTRDAHTRTNPHRVHHRRTFACTTRALSLCSFAARHRGCRIRRSRCTSARLAALSARSCLVKPGPSTRGLLSHYITSLIVLLARGFGILHALCLDFPLPGRQRRAGLRIVVRQRTTGS